MASLKEIKERIASVRGTRKITSAMKMVAAAKLHRAQRAMGALVPYADELGHITAHLVGGEGMPALPLATEREVHRAVIVGFASNSTLCGAYNVNVVRSVLSEANRWHGEGAEVEIVAVGAQTAHGVQKGGMECTAGYDSLADRPTYEEATTMAERLMERFGKGECDKVVLVYHKFLSAGTQRLVCEELLPIGVERHEGVGELPTEYILEPSRDELLHSLVPRLVALRLYTAALSASASEHAARMMAMQTATDNADDLISELAVEYNKQRQQAITTELLDIMGGQNGR